MARQRGAPIIQYAAIEINGDVGPFTVYTRRSGVITFYNRAPPLNPANTAQLRQRARFQVAMFDYSILPETERSKWKTIARKAGTSFTGPSLYLTMALSYEARRFLPTVARQAGESSPPHFKAR